MQAPIRASARGVIEASIDFVCVSLKSVSLIDVCSYNMSLSPDARNLTGQSSIGLGGGTFGGSLMKENCTMQSASGSPWSYTNQTVIRMDVTSTSATPFGNGISGLIGLGTLKTPTNATGFNANFDDSIYGQYYIRNPAAANFTFGMMLNPSPVIPGNSSTQLSIAAGSSSLADQSGGTIHWLQPDPSSYDTNQVSWCTVQGNISGGYMASNQQPDLTVQLNGWSAKVGDNNVANSANLLANVDPFYPGIYLPRTEAILIRKPSHLTPRRRRPPTSWSALILMFVSCSAPSRYHDPRLAAGADVDDPWADRRVGGALRHPDSVQRRRGLAAVHRRSVAHRPEAQ